MKTFLENTFPASKIIWNIFRLSHLTGQGRIYRCPPAEPTPHLQFYVLKSYLKKLTVLTYLPKKSGLFSSLKRHVRHCLDLFAPNVKFSRATFSRLIVHHVIIKLQTKHWFYKSMRSKEKYTEAIYSNLLLCVTQLIMNTCLHCDCSWISLLRPWIQLFLMLHIKEKKHNV